MDNDYIHIGEAKTLLYSNNKCINIFYTNLRSIGQNLDILITYLQLLDCKIDIIFISELWLNAFHDCSAYKINGYKFFYSTSGYNKASGVGIYVSDNINCIQVQNNSNSVDFCLLRMNSKFSNTHWYIGSMYCSPDLDFNTLYNNIEDHLKFAYGASEDILIIGDINVDHNKCNNNDYNRLNGLLAQYGLLQHIKGITRPQNQSLSSEVEKPKSGSGIDWVISNMLTNDINAYILLEIFL